MLEQSEIVSIKNVGKTSLGSIDFFIDNPVPIQAVVFRKELYMSCGGLDPELDALEDWDLWMRMACKTQIASVEKATSIFRVPEDPKEFEKGMPISIGIEKRFIIRWQVMRDFYSSTGIWSILETTTESRYCFTKQRVAEKSRRTQLHSSWKIMAPFRKLFNRIEKMGHKIFGPNEIDFEQATTDELRRYCMILKTHGCGGFFGDCADIFV